MAYLPHYAHLSSFLVFCKRLNLSFNSNNMQHILDNNDLRYNSLEHSVFTNQLICSIFDLIFGFQLIATTLVKV